MNNANFTPGPWFIETVHCGDEKWDEIRDKTGISYRKAETTSIPIQSLTPIRFCKKLLRRCTKYLTSSYILERASKR